MVLLVLPVLPVLLVLPVLIRGTPIRNIPAIRAFQHLSDLPPSLPHLG
jgi:hypothetical protein